MADTRKTPSRKAATKAAPRRRAARKPAAGKAATLAARAKAAGEDRRLGVRIIQVAAAAVGLGGALLALARLSRRDPAEHAAPDLAPGAPTPGTNRAPVDFRPDPSAVPTRAEYDSLRPATGPGPSMIQGEPGLVGPTATTH